MGYIVYTERVGDATSYYPHLPSQAWFETMMVIKLRISFNVVPYQLIPLPFLLFHIFFSLFLIEKHIEQKNQQKKNNNLQLQKHHINTNNNIIASTTSK